MSPIFSRLKSILSLTFMILILGGTAVSLHAVTAEVEKYDSKTVYSVLPGTANILYLDKCSRSKLNAYQWDLWQGNHGVKAYIEPVALITVVREKDEPFTRDMEPFFGKAMEEAVKLGGHLVCYVSLKKAPENLGIHSMTFRAYRQVFLSGVKEWEQFYDEQAVRSLPLTLKDVQTEPSN